MLKQVAGFLEKCVIEDLAVWVYYLQQLFCIYWVTSCIDNWFDLWLACVQELKELSHIVTLVYQHRLLILLYQELMLWLF